MAAPALSRPPAGRPRVALAVAGWALAVAVGAAVGRVLLARGTHIVLPTPPVLGRPVGASIAGLAFAAALGAALVAVLPRLARALPWRRALAVAVLASAAWWVGLALAEGASGLVRGPENHTEYLHDVPAVREDPARFLRTFTDEIERYEIHVRGHPPGMVLLLAGLDAAGLGGARWEAAVVIAAASTAPVAVLLTLRGVAGEAFARAAMPFVVLAPAAIWIATSADALYMAVAAWAVAALVAATATNGWRAYALAAVSGAFGAAALLGSYGMVLAATIPAAVVVKRRRPGPALAAAAVAAALLAALLPLGFSWVDGLAATRHEYETLDLDRPYAAFFFVNLGAWALALGPATVAGFAALRDRRAWLLVGGGLSAALLANLSGLSEGEVERIWLPFGIWVLPAAAALATRSVRTHAWLLAQVVTALVVVGTVRTTW